MTSELKVYISSVGSLLELLQKLLWFLLPLRLIAPVDSLYSTAKRMGHGGQLNERTHRQHYQPNNPGADGQDAYLQGKLRTHRG
jgi:hypothetical protein